MLGRATGNTDTQDSSQPEFGEATTFPLKLYFVANHETYIQMTFLSHDSRVGVPKLCQRGLPQLWSPITLQSDLGLKCGLKKSYSSRRDLSKDMWHVICS